MDQDAYQEDGTPVNAISSEGIVCLNTEIQSL